MVDNCKSYNSPQYIPLNLLKPYFWKKDRSSKEVINHKGILDTTWIWECAGVCVYIMIMCGFLRYF